MGPGCYTSINGAHMAQSYGGFNDSDDGLRIAVIVRMMVSPSLMSFGGKRPMWSRASGSRPMFGSSASRAGKQVERISPGG